MKPDFFDELAAYVPEPHLQEYWRLVAHLRQLKPDDEILRICQAMGILTFILRELPSELISERKSLQTILDIFLAEIVKIAEETTRHAVSVNNQSEILSRSLEHYANLYCEASNRFEKLSQEAIKLIDVDAMAAKVTARVEERVIKPFDELNTKFDQKLGLMDKADKQLNTTINTLRSLTIWPTLGGIIIGMLGLSAGVILYGLNAIQAADQVSIGQKIAQIESTANSNQEAFAELAKDQIHIEVTGVTSYGGQIEGGRKCLRLTPSAGVREDTPDNQPKSGLIFFQVPETWSQKAVDLWGH
jgi:hypothetical protein